jgi:hypothetical protein
MKKVVKKVAKFAERNVAVEIPLVDGTECLLIGKMVNRTPEGIFLKEACMIKDTGRRNLFFAGQFDSSVEAEPYPDDMEIELPAKGARIYSWADPLISKAI